MGKRQPNSGSEKLWFIVGRHGLYVGGRGSRREAIREHVNALDEGCYKAPRAWGALSAMQRKVWKRCRRDGDRAVKATVSWEIFVHGK